MIVETAAEKMLRRYGVDTFGTRVEGSEFWLYFKVYGSECAPGAAYTSHGVRLMTVAEASWDPAETLVQRVIARLEDYLANSGLRLKSVDLRPRWVGRYRFKSLHQRGVARSNQLEVHRA